MLLAVLLAIGCMRYRAALIWALLALLVVAVLAEPVQDEPRIPSGRSRTSGLATRGITRSRRASLGGTFSTISRWGNSPGSAAASGRWTSGSITST